MTFEMKPYVVFEPVDMAELWVRNYWAGREWPIAGIELDDVPLLNACKQKCFVGECSAPMSAMGCGGCCSCLGGCQVEYERQSGAPFLWEGDYS